jgi:hypothetical protein
VDTKKVEKDWCALLSLSARQGRACSHVTPR